MQFFIKNLIFDEKTEFFSSKSGKITTPISVRASSEWAASDLSIFFTLEVSFGVLQGAIFVLLATIYFFDI